MQRTSYLIFDSPFSPQAPSTAARSSLVGKLSFISARYRQMNLLITIFLQLLKFEKVF